ncbi:hypothetical protein M5K25_000847 [Dendrobium thyrsiflorum]|uniref:NB-ARC domain-containing protein n=1 Tax=Dendrobium thyrsiflorum TaxID=117978 RepID=A0ABD0VV13_DENTH
MAEWVVGPIMDKIINACSEYLKDQVGWQTGLKKELESLRDNHPMIKAVIFAAIQANLIEFQLEHQEQQLELYRAGETGALPKNDLIGRGKEKELVMEWLRKPLNDFQTTLVTTRMDSVAMKIAKIFKKEEKIFRLEVLKEDECLELLNSHAFAGVENPPDDHKKLKAIAGEIVKKLLGSPLAAKVIGGVLNDNLDERHWRAVLENNLLGQNYTYSILRLSYIFLPNPLQNCFAFCCKFPQYQLLNRLIYVKCGLHWVSFSRLKE